jgi:hypothetical protein
VQILGAEPQKLVHEQVVQFRGLVGTGSAAVMVDIISEEMDKLKKLVEDVGKDAEVVGSGDFRLLQDGTDQLGTPVKLSPATTPVLPQQGTRA